jgi:hypothetical protein
MIELAIILPFAGCIVASLYGLKYAKGALKLFWFIHVIPLMIATIAFFVSFSVDYAALGCSENPLKGLICEDH